MSTFLFDKIVFGPVSSRRLGISLGINLLPVNFKLCNFDCIYCECGFTLQTGKIMPEFYSREKISGALSAKLSQQAINFEKLDSITFAGNGEPTLHPEFSGIIDDTIALRDKYFPGTKISVLSNASTISNNIISDALKKIDNIILKLDSGNENTLRLINNPSSEINIPVLISNLKKFGNKFIIQSLFLKGMVKGQIIDNTTEEEVSQWLKLIEIIHPELVMIYTFARSTPYPSLEKASNEKMNEISGKVRALGINAEVFD